VSEGDVLVELTGIEPARLASLGGRFRRLFLCGGRAAPPEPPRSPVRSVQHG